jgi:hypothetical protein
MTGYGLVRNKVPSGLKRFEQFSFQNSREVQALNNIAGIERRNRAMLLDP